ncbi:MAG: hypothetical protein CME26_05520 [Gemmatimonadetes bacterium]|nr:hypothetical protein [Gemmatimonadota bacterium]
MQIGHVHSVERRRVLDDIALVSLPHTIEVAVTAIPPPPGGRNHDKARSYRLQAVGSFCVFSHDVDPARRVDPSLRVTVGRDHRGPSLAIRQILWQQDIRNQRRHLRNGDPQGAAPMVLFLHFGKGLHLQGDTVRQRSPQRGHGVPKFPSPGVEILLAIVSHQRGTGFAIGFDERSEGFTVFHRFSQGRRAGERSEQGISLLFAGGAPRRPHLTGW